MYSAQCSVYRGRRAYVRIWGVTGPRKWLHLFNFCFILLSQLGPQLFLFVKISPPARPSRGASRPFSVECCPLRLAALGQPSQACKCPRGGNWTELSPRNHSGLCSPVEITSRAFQQSSFSPAALVMVGACAPIQDPKL